MLRFNSLGEYLSDVPWKKYFAFSFLLFIVCSVFLVPLYANYGLGYCFKYFAIFSFILISILLLGNIKLFLIVYPFLIAKVLNIVVFSPYFNPQFIGIWVETIQNYVVPNALFAHFPEINLYNLYEFGAFIVFLDILASRKKLKYNKIFIFLMWYLIFASFSLFTAVNFLNTVITLLQLALSFLPFLLILQVLGEDETYDDLFLTLVLLVVFIISIPAITKESIVNLLRGTFLIKRESGILRDPNLTGMVSGMGVLFSLYLYFKKGDFKAKFLYAFITVFLLIAIACTGSRNALIATGFSVPLFLILYLRSGAQKKEKFIFSAILIFGVLLVSAYLARIIIKYRLNPNFLKFDLSAWQRLQMWRMSIEYFLHNPFKPLGMGNFFFFEGSFYFHHHPHNIFVENLIECGIIPFLMILFVAFNGLKVVFKNFGLALKGRVSLEEVVGSSFIIYALTVLSFDFMLYKRNAWRFFLIFLAFAISKLSKDKYKEKRRCSNEIQKNSSST